MKKSYRTIWNDVCRAWVAVSEIVVVCGARCGNVIMSCARRPKMSIFRKRLALALFTLLFSGAAHAVTGFYVNDNGDTACYGIVDGGTTRVISSSATCNTTNTTTVMTNSGMMVVGGVQGAGSIGGLPTSIGGVTTAGGSTANTYGFYVLNNGAYINGTTNGTQIIGGLRAFRGWRRWTAVHRSITRRSRTSRRAQR
ncbi:ESPR-type extended signal peptide-containing protein [Caballeronia sp. BR00000012568055]|uniref:ESPR-type extended signal peptide-containing protein n=1 Tax=Caballeronia sp. BR00000012568055 TaxID=2918761 RepID=UPI0023F93869|nr:ESPR-type extended signal peptide-containing protein [Caballeronia sp. BR00000012568055]